MRYFNRGKEPEGLKKARKKIRSWNDLNRSRDGASIKEEIRTALFNVQHGCCAYCDVRLRKKDGSIAAHIEHLKRRSDDPKRELVWTNLFLSCCNEDSCGYYKDHRRILYDMEDIIDPSIEDPQDFFAYSPSDGRIEIRSVSVADKKRAEKTIDVFNLANSPKLRGIRRRIAEIVADFCRYEPSDEQIEEFLIECKDEDCFPVYCCLLRRKTREFDD